MTFTVALVIIKYYTLQIF